MLFDSQASLYKRETLAGSIEPAELDTAIRAIHILVWKDWLRGSLEQQQIDLRVFASESFETMEAFVAKWVSARPYLRFPPESASPQERAIFVNNLEILLGELRNKCGAPSLLSPPHLASDFIQRVLERISEAYADPELSLETISRTLGISRRHLQRKWKEYLDQSFGDYLADFRMEKAAALLKDSSFGIKAISSMVGYKDHNYFIRDFRKRMSCTLGQLRANLRLLHNSSGSPL